MVDRDKVLNAAAQLEDIAVIAKMMVTDLREGADNPYGRVYWLRRLMTYVVNDLGAGTPTGLQAIEDYYERQINLHEE